MAAHVAGFGDVLDLDDLGAQVGELQRAERAGAILFHRDDADAGEREHLVPRGARAYRPPFLRVGKRSEEHTSELHQPIRNTNAAFFFKKKITPNSIFYHNILLNTHKLLR